MSKVATYRVIRCLGVCLLLAFSLLLHAQANHSLTIVPANVDSVSVPDLSLQQTFPSQAKCNEYLQQLPSLLQAQGYVSASVDSISQVADKTTAWVFIGQRFTLAALRMSDSVRVALQQTAFLKKKGLDQLSFDQVYAIKQQLLTQFESNGYPFATVQLDSITIKDQQVQAALVVQQGRFYTIDSIRVIGPARLKQSFLNRYLDIEKGSPYNLQKLNAIDQRLLELSYVQQQQPWDVTMLNTGSIVNLYLQPRKCNQVNVLAGFLPDNQQLGGGKLLFTIDANLQLNNAFSTGEQISLVWQQIQPRSPRLNLQYQQPYLFKSPLGLDVSFNLLKKDSLFLNLNASFGLRYMFSANHFVKVGIQQQKTNVLELDTFSIKQRKQLPDVADVSAVNLQVEYEMDKTDYKFNPRRGSAFSVSSAFGSKTIQKSNAILQIKDPAFNFNRLYDSVRLNTYQIRIRANAAHYFSIGRQSVLKTAINAGLYQSPNAFVNELFQIGGYRLLRGFDEESIFASRYGVATAEYRLLLGQNSYFFGFTDYGWSSQNSRNTKASNSYLGAGLGLAVETKGGIFNISFAAGKQSNQPFSIRQSKIHFGYVSLF